MAHKLRVGVPREYSSLLKRAIDLSSIEFPTDKEAAAAKYVPMLYDTLVKDDYPVKSVRRIIVADLCNKEGWPFEYVVRHFPTNEE